jgi:hypothetical protein
MLHGSQAKARRAGKCWGRIEYSVPGIAAAASGGTVWVYSSPVRDGARGSVVLVSTGPVVQGLVAAKRRLALRGERGW